MKQWKLLSLVLTITLSYFIDSDTKVHKEDLPYESALRIGIKKRGTDCSIRATEGDTLSIHYIGQYYVTNEVFDSSRERGKPLTLILGEYLTILGLDRGLLGSCVGDIRKITIPRNYTHLAEPDNHSLILVDRTQTLVYTIEVLDINPIAKEDDYDDDEYEDDEEEDVEHDEL